MHSNNSELIASGLSVNFNWPPEEFKCSYFFSLNFYRAAIGVQGASNMDGKERKGVSCSSEYFTKKHKGFQNESLTPRREIQVLFCSIYNCCCVKICCCVVKCKRI